MPLAPSSPNSPTRRRRNLSDLDFSSTAPSSFTRNGYGQSPPYSPETPRTSIPHSPVTTRHRISSSGGMERPARYSGDFTPDVNADSGDGGGLGSLADELANAWDDGYEYGYGGEDTSGLQDGEGMVSIDGVDSPTSDNASYIESIHDMGIGMGGGLSHGDSGSGEDQLKPPRQRLKGHSRHRRHESLYDGSDYGNDSDFDEPGDMSPGLEAQMAGIDDLVRWSKADETSNELIDQFIGLLRELGGQAGIENSTTRLITAHSSLVSHLTHQTRSLQTLTHPLLISSFPTLSPDAIDDLLPLIDSILPNLPFPDQHQSTHHRTDSTSTSDPDHSSAHSRSHSHTTPLLSLQSLLSQTSDLTHTLRTLNDTLHESRQLTSTASRRLKTVRELVIEMRREGEAREEGIRWIEKGGWDAKLAAREAGTVCQSVVSGFEAVCGEWRNRLFGTAAAGAGATATPAEVTVS
ncbi:hypothetical protein D8B26_008036 [Coccidioides posadasii str. Silveira]|uniref:Uncharacterized protein n=2 Tax=Coccidioides posadasii TaxID=199306 RepID=E9DE61_COCPS|nr:hypothetical protein CPC735_069960 [Coccidioides posadasii C735 delta SOWgp]EER29314.1 hypothetical protein CPC735_069960 [Coccidioides posadasii C735 delta SOWgp]EFW15415.1 conserved hypothetical protein [Coccidioides posadasii str. Silveira]QVM13428.1 hypothetical protein D8B26_008036 [Coccidioides posadasii str. Silveira]|eukprot:XP_003071459.1 hypothetical protein CPC735_069960 [Coccidioides posadasii C735 delta SOWgp]